MMSRKIFSVFSLTTLIFSGAMSGSVYAEEKSSGSGISGETTVMETIEVVAERDKKPAERYQKKMDRRKIETSGQGNGDIGSLLRSMSNVQYDNAFNSSSTPGEIDPARISISGGQFYQNLITIDGVNISGRLDPADTSSLSPWYALPGTTQTVNIDVDLLDSITVLDSAISAKYGGFSGGVVETELRRPTKPLGMKLSYKFTNGNIERGWPHSLTKYHLGDNEDYEAFVGSFNKDRQPEFRKYVTQLTAESRINEKFALLGSLNIQESIIPLRQHNPSYVNRGYVSPVDPDNIVGEQKDTKRKNTNAILKAYLDPSDDLSLEFGYTYAPNFSREQFAGSAKGMYYDIEHGGDIVNFRTKWNNAWGKFTNTLNYQETGDRVVSHGYTHTRDWQISDSKHWSSYSGVAREAGVIDSERDSKKLTDTFEQEFKPFKLGITEHRILTGGEFSYTKTNFQFPRSVFIARSARAMSSAMAERCRQTDGFWCDLAQAYDPDRYFAKDGTDAVQDYSWYDPVAGITREMYYWPHGQYFTSAIHYEGGNPISVSDKQLALFLEDEIKIPLGEQKQVGEVTVRPGLRYEYNSYMKEHDIAPRLFTDYAFPWSGPDKSFSTHISAGYNRYYGNNLYTYRLEDGIESKQLQLRRDDPGRTFEDILAENRDCIPYSRRERDPVTRQWKYYHIKDGVEVEGQDSNCISGRYANDTKFTELKTPYADEYMIGVSQDLGLFNLTAKYVRRNGRNEVVRTYGRQQFEGYNDNPYYYTNEGKSTSNIVTVDLKNTRPLTFWGIKNNFALAFDWTQTKRSKNTYTDTYTLTQYENPYILYDGELMQRWNMPSDNFVKPWSLKLETTHEWQMLGGLWTLNNLFTFKQKYKRHVTSTSWNMPGSDFGLDQDTVSVYRITDMPSTFTWDLKFGAEYEVYKKNKLFFNVDIYNLTNKKNVTTFSSTNSGDIYRSYATGLQVWFEFGYKY